MTTLPEPMDIALRAWAVPDRTRDNAPPLRRHRPSALVVLDCETEFAGAQHLLVACYRYVRVSWHGQVPTLATVEEGLVVPDDLADRDPDGFGLVHDYARRSDPSVDLAQHGATGRLLVLTRADFCERMLWEACWRGRATLVAFNLGFDLSRLRLSWHEGRGRHKGAFVLRLWEWEGADHRYRPNVVARRLDSRRTLFAWTGVLDPPKDGTVNRALDDHFLDLRTLSFALTNASHTLESACQAFGVDYEKRPVRLGVLSDALLDYVRSDVAATTKLAGATLTAFHRHPVALSADRAYSPAAIGAAYLRRVGVRPPRSHAEISSAQMAEAMAAFYGPRVEVRVRHVPVPVSLVDFSSQYANVARLLGLWDLLTSERLVAVDATDEVRALMERCDVESVLDPGFWRKLVGVVLVRPAGDRLPTRAWFAGRGDVPRVGVGPLLSDRVLPFPIADVVAAKLSTGRTPEIESAWRVVGEGRASKLRVALLGGSVRFDPYSDDWWAALIGARAALGQSLLADGLKTIGNGTAYGNWIRLDQQPRPDSVTVYGRDGSESRQSVERPEEPFVWTFPPFASAVTAGGRLLMALVERLLADQDGVFASANTDSASIVSLPFGGLVACPGGSLHLPDGTTAVGAITWAQVDELRARFLLLGVSLNLTSENFFVDGTRRRLHAVAIAGSRVIIYRELPGGRREIVKRSEVALGDLRSPLGAGTSQTFLDETASWMLDHVLDGAATPRPWFTRSAAAEMPMGTPGKVRSLGDRGSPFGFAVGARRSRKPTGVLHGEPVRLIAPAGEDPAVTGWVEVPSGRPVAPDEVKIANYGEELVRLVLHPESKMLGPDEKPCRYTTTGLLRPRAVLVAAIHTVGKEGNRIEEVATGEVTDPDEVMTDYGDDAWVRLVCPVARLMGVRKVHRETGIALSQVTELLSGRAVPRATTEALLIGTVSGWAARELGRDQGLAEDDPHAVLAEYLVVRSQSGGGQS